MSVTCSKRTVSARIPTIISALPVLTFLLMRLVGLLFKEHVVAHYCAAVNRVPQWANAIAPWTQPTETERILMWDQDNACSNKPRKKFCHMTTRLMNSRRFRSWPTMLCGIIPHHARDWSRAHLSPRTLSCIESVSFSITAQVEEVWNKQTKKKRKAQAPQHWYTGYHP